MSCHKSSPLFSDGYDLGLLWSAAWRVSLYARQSNCLMAEGVYARLVPAFHEYPDICLVP